MNKLFTFFLFIFLFSIQSKAQVYFGIRAGANLSNLNRESSIPNLGEQDYLLGIDAALVLNIGLTYSLSLQPEVHYLQKGYKHTLNGESTKYKFSYIETPVLLKWFVGNDIFGVTFGAGPYGAYGVKYEIQQGDFSETYDFELLDSNRLDYGLTGAFGIEYFLGNHLTVLDFRYSYGLKNFSFDETKSSNTSINAGLTFFF